MYVYKHSSNLFGNRLPLPVMVWSWLQVIVFSFSKKECEARALEMNLLDLTDDDEKKLIDSIYTSAMESLSLEDQKLPQV